MQRDVVFESGKKARLALKRLSDWLDAILISERSRKRERMERKRYKSSIPFTVLQGWFYFGLTIFLSLLLARLVVS